MVANLQDAEPSVGGDTEGVAYSTFEEFLFATLCGASIPQGALMLNLETTPPPLTPIPLSIALRYTMLHLIISIDVPGSVPQLLTSWERSLLFISFFL